MRHLIGTAVHAPSIVGSVHASSAAKTITRVVDTAPEDNRDQMRSTLSVLLKGVVAQHLVRRASWREAPGVRRHHLWVAIGLS
jgi:Tfp pilus assembly pilus retraction ATPase PilT